MRKLPILFLLSLVSSPAAWATSGNQYFTDFWQLNFEANYGGDATKPVAYVQAHVGQETYDNDSSGQPLWDSNYGLIPLTSKGDHYYANFAIEHIGNPELTGGYKGAVVQYHYFLKGEESQIDPKSPFTGGHWTQEYVYENTAYFPDASYRLSSVITATSSGDYSTKKLQANSQMAQDASQTSVVEVQWQFAD